MDENFRIPESERHKFAQPLGDLISGSRKETLSEVIKRLKDIKGKGLEINCYLVGDIVSQDFLTSEFLKKYVRLCIVDEKTRRYEIDIDFEAFFEEVIEMVNPQGSINKESFGLLKGIIESRKRTLLKITEGEEDLLVLPLVQELPLIEGVKNYVFYGQPPITDSKKVIPEGIVMVDVNKKIQKVVKQFIQIMVNK